MNTEPKIAIHAHAFYPHIWPEIRQCVHNFIDACGPENVFLCITYPEGNTKIGSTVKKDSYSCKYQMIPFPNRGHDVGPFICAFLNRINLDDYDYVVKLHTKRDVDTWINYRPLKGSQWRKLLLFFCATRDAVVKSIRSFEKYDKIGMLSAHRTINYCGSDWGEEATIARHLLEKEFSIFPKHLVTASGTIFMIRANLLKCFQNRYAPSDFNPITFQTTHSNYGLASLLEYAFAMRADADGYIISEGKFNPTIARFGYWIQSIVFMSMRKLMNLLRKHF